MSRPTRQRQDRADDRRILVIPRQIGDERLVDLDLVERECGQAAERRIAGAEIVERQRNSDAPEPFDEGMVFQRAFQQHGFGDLDLQPLRRQPGILQRRLDHVEQFGLLELDRRQVDGDLDVGRPRHRVVAGAPDHPFAERNDQAGLLGQRNELVGRNEPAGRMPPAHQRFRAAPLAGLHVEERLIVHLELTARDGVAQIAFEGIAGLEVGRHRLVVDGVAVPARRFRTVQREIGLLQQLVLARAMLGRQRNPDAGSDFDAMTRQHERLGDEFGNSCRQFDRTGALIVARRLDHREFVAAEPRQHVGRSAASISDGAPPDAAVRRRRHGRASR